LYAILICSVRIPNAMKILFSTSVWLSLTQNTTSAAAYGSQIVACFPSLDFF
jgi:hypothetical protein